MRDRPETGDVLIDCISTRVERGELMRLTGLLTADERGRAARFRFAADRDRFVVARARLRLVLASFGAGPPERIRLAHGAHGKPLLPAHPELQFNVSHAGDLALIAVARRAAVGVDLERLDRRHRLEDVAACCFSGAERAALARLDPCTRAAAVVRCWCRKEAYLKARGVGLTLPLDSFDVATDVRTASFGSLLLATRARTRDVEDWDLRDVDVGADYVAAVALRGRIRRVSAN